MSIDILNIEPHVVSRDLKGKIIFIYGDPKVGKTTLASKFPKPLLLAFEKGYNAISGIRPANINKWTEYKTILRQLEKPEAKEMYDTIIIDTVDIAYMLAEKYICQKDMVEEISDISWGKGYSRRDKEFDEALRAIPAMGYGLVMISHSTSTNAQATDGTEYKKIVPTLDKNAKIIVSRMADVYGYGRTVYNDEGQPVPRLYLRSTPYYEAGSRFPYITDCVPLSYEHLKTAILDAIDEGEEHGDTVVDTQMENLYKTNVVDFEEVLSKAGEVIKTIMSHIEKTDPKQTDKVATDISAIIEDHLGKGSQLRLATPEQADIIVLIVDELIEYHEQLVSPTEQ